MKFAMEQAVVYPWLALAFVWAITAIKSKRTAYREPLPSRLFHILFMAGVFALLFRPDVRVGVLAARVVPSSWEVGALGFVLTTLGVAFAIWARLTLGGNWSGSVTVKQDHELVLRGPYRFVRHPIYSGFLLVALGTALVFGELGCFVAVLLALVGFWLKARIEEQFMTNTFGDNYRQYQRSVKQMIPFLL